MPGPLACSNCRQLVAETAPRFAQNLVCSARGCVFRTRELVKIHHANPGYRCDFEDFRSLLRDAPHADLMTEVFVVTNLILAGSREAPALRRTTGEPVTLEDAHVVVQGNASAQRGLYNVAMRL